MWNIGPVQLETNLIQFAVEKEAHDAINFLYLLMQSKEKEFEYKIWGKSPETHNSQLLLPCVPTHKYQHNVLHINCLVGKLSAFQIWKE
jgi:hypothetical protein